MRPVGSGGGGGLVKNVFRTAIFVRRRLGRARSIANELVKCRVLRAGEVVGA